jgi:uncharacterized Tic20 family protein
MEAAGQQTTAVTSCPACGADVALAAGAACPVCGAPAPAPPPDHGVAPPPVPDSAVASASPAQARDIVVWTHLSALIGLIGVPSPVGPLVVWLVKRDAHPLVDAQGKEALNFNLSALLYLAVLFVTGLVFTFLTFGLGLFLFVPAFIAAMAAWVVLVIVAAVKASKGELFRYPITIRFVR